MVYNNSTNLYGTNAFIVSSTAGKGNYLTIASAITAASSGDTIFLKNGTYTENVTMKAGVNLSADATDSTTPSVVILGELTCNYTGTCSISGIELQPNGTPCLGSTTGTAVLNLLGCSILCNRDYAMSANNSAFQINLYNCTADSTGVTYALFSWSALSSCRFIGCDFSNLSTAVTSNSLAYAGQTLFEGCTTSFPMTTNGGGYIVFNNSTLDTSAANTTSMTINDSTTGESSVTNSSMSSGTATSLNIGTSTTTNCDYTVFTNTNTYDVSTA